MNPGPSSPKWVMIAGRRTGFLSLLTSAICLFVMSINVAYRFRLRSSAAATAGDGTRAVGLLAMTPDDTVSLMLSAVVKCLSLGRIATAVEWTPEKSTRRSFFAQGHSMRRSNRTPFAVLPRLAIVSAMLF